MKKILIAFVLVFALFTVYSCGDKNPTKHDDIFTKTSTPVNTATITATKTISQTSTISATRTVSPTCTDTGTETATRTHTVSPTVTATRTSTPFTSGIYCGANIGSYDTYISKASSGNNYGGCGEMLIGANIPGTSVYRGVLRFGVASNMPVLPSTIFAVNIKLIVSSAIIGAGAIEAYNLSEAFVEGKFCDAASTTCTNWTRTGTGFWGSVGGKYDPPLLGSVNFTNGMPAGTVLRIPISLATLQGWHDNDATNYGVLLRLANEGVAADTTATFYAADWPYTSAGIGLEIIYYP